MKFSGNHLVDATREQIWRAFNDPEILQQIIPGARVVRRVSESEFFVESQIKVGPVSASLKGKLFLSNVIPAESFTISGEGKGVAGFAKGSAQVRFQDVESDKTLLSYDVQSTVGGKLAQIGQRFLDTMATRMTEEFFAALSEALEPFDTGTVSDSISEESDKAKSRYTSLTSKLIVGGTVLVILVLFLYLMLV